MEEKTYIEVDVLEGNWRGSKISYEINVTDCKDAVRGYKAENVKRVQTYSYVPHENIFSDKMIFEHAQNDLLKAVKTIWRISENRDLLFTYFGYNTFFEILDNCSAEEIIKRANVYTNRMQTGNVFKKKSDDLIAIILENKERILTCLYYEKDKICIGEFAQSVFEEDYVYTGNKLDLDGIFNTFNRS